MPATGESSAFPSAQATIQPPSYAAMVSRVGKMSPRLAPVPLANRTPTLVDNIQAILLISVEEAMGKHSDDEVFGG